MVRCREILVGLAVLLTLSGVAAAGESVLFVRDGESLKMDLSDLPIEAGAVAYEGPMMDSGSENWKAENTFSGPSLRAIAEAAGGLDEGETLSIVAADGWSKTLPKAVVYGETDAGTAILATAKEGEGDDWESGPMLVFLPEDGRFSNDDMLASFGSDLSHYFGEAPSTMGMMVKNVEFLVVDYDGDFMTLFEAEVTGDPAAAFAGTDADSASILLTLVKGEETLEYTLADLQELDVLTAPGTFTNSADADYTATYTGVPLMDLIGNVALDSTVRVTASDGYSMNYAVELLADTNEGVWILAFEENGEPMPLDPGPLRIVQIGEGNPHFTSSLSAKMVEQIELLGIYEPYALTVTGAVDRTFERAELESGVGCPCHTATVSVTSKGETHTYTGLPLWRLIAYVDDDVFPAPEDGIHYNDEDFSDALAERDYAIHLVASDGYTQTAQSSWIARDDRFVVAFKMDGVFLDPESSGYMRFVYDDSVELPEDARLRSVKFLTEIQVEL